MALARKYRLAKNDLNRLFRQGKTVRDSFLFIRFSKNDLEHIRMAAIIPIKVSKKATVRNQLKRIFTRTIQTGHFLKKSYDVAIIATINIVGKTQKEIKRNLEQTINKVFV